MPIILKTPIASSSSGIAVAAAYFCRSSWRFCRRFFRYSSIDRRTCPVGRLSRSSTSATATILFRPGTPRAARMHATHQSRTLFGPDRLLYGDANRHRVRCASADNAGEPPSSEPLDSARQTLQLMHALSSAGTSFAWRRMGIAVTRSSSTFRRATASRDLRREDRRMTDVPSGINHDANATFAVAVTLPAFARSRTCPGVLPSTAAAPAKIPGQTRA